MHSNMRVAVTASYFQPVLQTMSDVKGTGAGGHGRPVWMADCRDDLLYDSLFGFLPLPVSLPLSSPPSLSLADFSFPMFFYLHATLHFEGESHKY